MRLDDLNEQIAEREAELATLEAAYGHADEEQTDRLALAIDQCTDELFQLRAAAEEIEGEVAMRRAALDRAWHRWRTL